MDHRKSSWRLSSTFWDISSKVCWITFNLSAGVNVVLFGEQKQIRLTIRSYISASKFGRQFATLLSPWPNKIRQINQSTAAATAANKKKLQIKKLYNRPQSIITGSGFTTASETVLTVLSWLNIVEEKKKISFYFNSYSRILSGDRNGNLLKHRSFCHNRSNIHTHI